MNGPTNVTEQQSIAFLPASRSRALFRALIWLGPALLLGHLTRILVQSVWLAEPALRNWLVDVSLFVVSLPIPILTLILAGISVRWLLLALWPGPVGFFAFAEGLEARLGPFRTKLYDRKRMQVRYFFELEDDDEAAGGFEAYLPEEEQMEKYLPRMKHPDAIRPLHEMILRYSHESELDAARALRPAIERWRAQSEEH